MCSVFANDNRQGTDADGNVRPLQDSRGHREEVPPVCEAVRSSEVTEGVMKLLPIPKDVVGWRLKEVLDRRLRIVTETTSEAKGVLRWKANRAIVPPWVFEEAFMEVSDAQIEARRKELDEFTAEYRKQDHTPDAEQMAEMRAAFGPGTTVVNVITGQKTKL
jgi:hypothetical protein